MIAPFKERTLMIKNKRMYATLIVNLMFAGTSLSAEEMNIVEDVKISIPEVVDIKDRELLREFLYLNSDKLSLDTQNVMNNVLKKWESGSIENSNKVDFNDATIITRPVGRLQVDADY